MDNQLKTTDGTVIDRGVLKVMKAIQQVESQGSYSAVGDGGDSHGAFQYNEKTGPGWKNIAKQYLGDENAPMDKANQNKATYLRIKQWKDEGKQPEEIAALWNGAKKGVDGKYTYNNPQYGEKFRQALMGGQPATAPKRTLSEAVKEMPQTSDQAPEQKKSLVDKILKYTGGNQIAEALGGLMVKGSIKQGSLPGVVEADYSKLSPEAIKRLEAKGVPTTLKGQREESASQVTMPTKGEVGRDALHLGTTIASLYGGGKLLSAVTPKYLGGARITNALKEPEIVKMLSQYNYPASANVTREQAIKRLTAELGKIPTSGIGGKTERLIIKALQELSPELAGKSGGFIRKLFLGGSGAGLLDYYGGYNALKNMVRPITDPLVRQGKDALTGSGQFSSK